jgi:hypothetical protein
MLVVLVLSAAFPASPPLLAQEAAPVAVNPSLLGMVVRDPWYEFGTNPRYPNQPNYEAQERMGQILAEAGVRWVRIEFIVRQDAGSWQDQIARNDYFINEVAPRHGLTVMGLLGFALVDIDPRDPQSGLVAKPPAQPHPVYEYAVNPWMADWLDRALWIMNRYQGRVAAYEVLNEQNRLPVIGSFGGGEGIDPEITATLHTKLYKCFRQNLCAVSSDPAWRAGVKLVLGGLHPRGSDKLLPTPRLAPGERPYVSDRDYLRRVYRSAAFKSYREKYQAYPVDGLGYHPYPVEIALSSLSQVQTEVGRIDARLGELRAMLRELLKNEDAAAAEVPFWITEIGYNAGYGRQSVTGQALFLRAIFTAMAARGDVATVFWFKYEDFPPAGGVDAQQWGIVRIPFTEESRCPGGACYAPNGEPGLRRPSFLALRELAGLPVERLALPLMRR